MTAALQLRGLSVRYGGLVALDGLDLELAAGERVALVGPNGAGKTTALDAIGGQVAPFAGQVLLRGRDITRSPPHRRAHAGLVRTFQHLGLVSALSLQDNLRLAAPGANIAALLARFGLEPYAAQPARALPRGAQRAAALARAVAGQPQVLLLDEPCAGLGREAAEGLLGVLTKLEVSPAILIVEHDLELLEGFVHRMVRLEAGRVADTTRRRPTEPTAPPGDVPVRRETRLHLSGLTVPAARLEALELEVRAGEIVSVVGPSGSGKSALASALAGELDSSGDIFVDRAKVSDLAPDARARAGLHVSPSSGGLVLAMKTQDNLRIALPRGASHANAYRWFPALAARRGQPAEVLSGGERRMLTLARAALCGRPVIVLDEPTTGLAQDAAEVAAEILRRRAREGAAIVLLEREASPASTRTVHVRELRSGAAQYRTHD